MEVVPDDLALIEDRAAPLRRRKGVRFVFTTGGTGLTPDDVTPEATRAVIERDAPGIAEAMRAGVAASTRRWGSSRAASRACAAQTLIVNFPGSPKAIEQLFPAAGAGARARRRDADPRTVARAAGH